MKKTGVSRRGAECTDTIWFRKGGRPAGTNQFPLRPRLEYKRLSGYSVKQTQKYSLIPALMSPIGSREPYSLFRDPMKRVELRVKNRFLRRQYDSTIWL